MKPCLFLWMPRTGGHSVNTACIQAAENPCVVWRRPSVWRSASDYVTFSHWSLDALIEAGTIPAAEIKRRSVFSFVRNPWDRLVSLWHYWRKHPVLRHNETVKLPFCEFAREICRGEFPHAGTHNYIGLSQARPQWDWIGQGHAHWVGRFEDLDNDWKDLQGLLGFEWQLGHESSTVHEHYREYYTNDLIQDVGRFYQADVEHLGYTFDGSPS